MTNSEVQEQILQLKQLMVEYLRRGSLAEADAVKFQIESLKKDLNESKSILLG
jgi:hypothetical protein